LLISVPMRLWLPKIPSDLKTKRFPSFVRSRAIQELAVHKAFQAWLFAILSFAVRLVEIGLMLWVKALDGRYARESRSQRTIESVRTMNKFVSIQVSSWALDDFHWRDGVVKPEAAQNSQDSFAG